MPIIFFKDHRRIGSDILEKEYSFGDYLVITEEEKEKDFEFTKVSFIHSVVVEEEEIVRCFKNIVENKYTYEECNGKCCKSDKEGSITPVRAFFSKTFQDFCNKEEELLENTITRFFDNALWIYKSSSLFYKDLRRHWLSFSFDQSNWHLVPILPLNVKIGGVDTSECLRLDKEVRIKNKRLAAYLMDSMKEGKTAPAYSRIYFESVENKWENPQTALLLAVESVEVGVKTCISRFDPQAKWLMENLPSPPIEKMLKEYVPTLIPHDAPIIPKELINHSLHKAIIARNRVVHSGIYDIDKEETEQLVADLGRILAYLDYYLGCQWASLFFDRPFNHWFFV